MLTYYCGNDLRKLADHFLGALDARPAQNPLAPESVVVQNHGMARWLSLYIAREKGIAANMKFEFPAERTWSLIRLVDASIPERLPSDKDPMMFAIMELLETDHSGVLKPLQRYIRDDSVAMQKVRSWKLSARIADVFDQYLIYRPEMLLSWEDGDNPYLSESAAWQAYLWNKLNERWERQVEKSAWNHRARLQRMLLKNIHDNSLDSKQLPGRMTVFGVSTMPPAFVNIFVSLSKIVDLQWFWMEPGNVQQTEHPLIKSMGSEGREFQEVFRDAIDRDGEVKNAFREIDMTSTAPGEKSVLNRVQKDLANGTLSNREHTPIDPSLQIHACHSPLREVEVLYDQLLALFDHDPSLSPDEIVIMTPDLDTYAPLIRSVFEAHEPELPRIPFHINDRSYRDDATIIQAFQKILALCTGRFKVTEIIDLLEIPALRKIRQLSIDEVSRLERWIGDNNIRWGIDGAFKQQQGVPESDHFTWHGGLSRMLLGYAMHGEGKEIYRGQVPYPEIEGTEAAELLGKFTRLMNDLFRFHQQTRKSRKPEAWISMLKASVSTFFPDPDEAYEQETTRLHGLLDKLSDSARLSQNGQKIPFRVVQSYVSQKLDEQQTGGYMGRGVTFCGLEPMRSIPCRVVGFLGMNEDSFPRRTSPVEFDLMANKPQTGDRSRSEDDRYLFLESLMSAKDHLYISYVGQSNRQNTSLPPSVVVTELINFLEEIYGIDRKALITRHRLQAFNAAYFDNSSPKLFSYSGRQLKAAENLMSAGKEGEHPHILFSELPEPGEEWSSLTLAELISFYQHPAKYVLQSRLGIYLPDEEVLDEDREPFSVQGLDKYYIRQQLFECFLKGDDPARLKSVLEGKDQLPERYPGARSFREELAEAKDFYSIVEPALAQPEEAIKTELSFELESVLITLRTILDNNYGGRQILYRFGKLREKERIDLWIRHLAFCTAKAKDTEPASIMYTYDGGEEKEVLKPVSKAGEILHELIQNYWKGLRFPLFLFPKSSFAYTRQMGKKPDESKALQEAQKMWEGGKYIYNADGLDRYNSALYKNYNPLQHSGFKNLSLWFWKPYFKSVVEG